MSEQQKTLYERLGGYDAIAGVSSNRLPLLTPFQRPQPKP
jgi:hypothetical protein